VEVDLSFNNFTEKERTKHVHRIHPFKGKFIPQLVEYFIKRYFKNGDIILDPFSGSGTTLVEANEQKIHAIGIDISPFSALISNIKVKKHNLLLIESIANDLVTILEKNQDNRITTFEKHLDNELRLINNSNLKLIDFLNIYYDLLNKYQINLLMPKNESFLENYFIEPIKKEINLLAEKIKNIDDEDTRNVLLVILSRTMRSCRCTTHSDLSTLKKPIIEPYYCRKHKKICKPIFSILDWWKFYVKDTINRFKTFDNLRTDTVQHCVVGDSRTVDIYEKLKEENKELYSLLLKQKIRGVISSPPYCDLIDYYNQHLYAYELFGFEKPSTDIGKKKSYVEDISAVLKNLRKYMQDNFDAFIVANDKYNFYPVITEKAKMNIIEKIERPVSCRAEKNRNLYYETVFHLK